MIEAQKLIDPQLPSYQEKRRRKILDTAYELLKDSEYDQIQIRDVAAAAGVALGTLYRYFSSKDQLYATALYDWALPFGYDAPEWENLKEMDRLAARIDRAITAFERRPQFFHLSMMLYQANDPAVTELAGLRMEALDNALLQDMKDFDEAEARNIASIFWGTLTNMFLRVGNGIDDVAAVRSAMSTLMNIVKARHQEVLANKANKTNK
ncbi:MAG TPA: TetR/AcrR family transcriptional regulator [Microbacteriaceae bacterium]|nr:TetR/AcrR family transcriptional regulator [Microbacteriaceae bacterium]